MACKDNSNRRRFVASGAIAASGAALAPRAVAAVALCCILALASCQGGTPSARAPSAPDSHDTNPILQITLRSATGWLLTIEPRGWGSIGYGSSAQDFAPFPPGTFDFAAVRDALVTKALPGGSIQRDFAVAFFRAGEASTTALYVSDSKMMKALFDKAVASADKTGTRVDELYAAYPPAPDAPAPL